MLQTDHQIFFVKLCRILDHLLQVFDVRLTLQPLFGLGLILGPLRKLAQPVQESYLWSQKNIYLDHLYDSL